MGAATPTPLARNGLMARVFITGSADGLGRLAAQTLLDDRHEVVVNVRNSDRVEAVGDLVDRGAAVVVGDLANLEQTRGIASVTTHDGDLIFVLDLSRFEKLAESFDHKSLLPAAPTKEVLT